MKRGEQGDSSTLWDLAWHTELGTDWNDLKPKVGFGTRVIFHTK